MYLQTSWHKLIAEMGDQPGDHKGNVTVYVTGLPGMSEFTVPSADVTVAAEQGCLVGVALKLPDGRLMFVPGANVTAIIDGPGTIAQPCPADETMPSQSTRLPRPPS